MSKEDRRGEQSQNGGGYDADAQYVALYNQYESVRAGQQAQAYAEAQRPREVQEYLNRKNRVIAAARAGVRAFPTESYFLVVFPVEVLEKTNFILGLMREGLWPNSGAADQHKAQLIADLNEVVTVLEAASGANPQSLELAYSYLEVLN